MGSKAVRKVPKVLLEWLEQKHGKAFADWYFKQANLGKRQISLERQEMSRQAGKTGAYHEGHFRGAEDIDPKLGGGPTTGLTMRPEIGAVNVAHKELPRIDYESMRAAGIPQNWIEDVYETVLEAEGLGVIGSYDTQAALDMDYGDVTPGQAQAQTDRRRQLRAQGVKQVGADTKVTFKPPPEITTDTSVTSLPDFAGGLAQEKAREKEQIAARRSSRVLDSVRSQVRQGAKSIRFAAMNDTLGRETHPMGGSVIDTDPLLGQGLPVRLP